jgi:hypothetical protein
MHPDPDDFKEDPLMANKVADSDSDSDLEDELDDEEYENQIKEDILRPASTRSKVVVNLKEPEGQKKGKRKIKQLGKNYFMTYIIDPYDAVRLKLMLPDLALWKAYSKTIGDIEGDINLQPRKRRMPCWLLAPIEIIKWTVMILFIYMFFLVIQLALFNLVIVGIVVVILTKIWQFL